jgi:ribose/xylose/arabinose/galactoside ABC-type transport system permease subunit
MTTLSLRGVALRAPGLGAVLGVLLALMINAAVTPGFFAEATLLRVLVQAVSTLLVGAGMTLVIATGGIDLSVGSVMALTSAIAVNLLPMGVPIALVGALALGMGFGAANGLVIARYGILPIIVTLATSMIGRGVAQVIVADNPLVVFTNPAFERLGKGSLGPLPVQVLITLAAVLVVWFIVRSTVFGRHLLALGGNERAARLAGVNVTKIVVLVYAGSGLLASLCGLIETARLGAADAGTLGLGAELDAIVAVVIGGTPLSGGHARVLGTVLGALLMSILSASFAMHLVPHAWSLVAKALILAAAVWMQRRRGTD